MPDNLVTAYDDQQGQARHPRRWLHPALSKVGPAGTARYVKNAASWPINTERFGDVVASDAIKPPAEGAARPTGSPSTIAPADPFIATRTIELFFVALMILLLGFHYIPALHRHE